MNGSLATQGKRGAEVAATSGQGLAALTKLPGLGRALTCFSRGWPRTHPAGPLARRYRLGSTLASSLRRSSWCTLCAASKFGLDLTPELTEFLIRWPLRSKLTDGLASPDGVLHGLAVDDRLIGYATA